MIHGTVSRWSKDKVFMPAAFDRALAFLNTVDAVNLPLGKHTIDGERIFALVQEQYTRSEIQAKFEVHQEYIDIQLLLSGREKQLYAPEPLNGIPGGAVLLEDQLDTADLAFYSAPKSYSTVELSANAYAIYLPGELHSPNCGVNLQSEPEKIRKIVFKIHKAA